MRPARVLGALVATLVASAAMAAATVTFTAGDGGSYPGTLAFDAETGVLSIDLSAIPADATVFRAELYPGEPGRFDRRPVEPTSVYPVGRPEQKLPFVAPRRVSLDALAPVREAVRTGEPLRLKVETVLRPFERLEVSYLEGKLPGERPPAVADVRVTHRSGQSLITFREPPLAKLPEFKTGADVAALRERLVKESPGLRFRIWRSAAKITPQTIDQASLVGECGLLTGWNDTYWQDKTKQQAPVRYRVADLGEPLPWGTGVYAHNPAAAGKAYYAVTVSIDGREDFDSLGSGNTTSSPVEETVGRGEPVLQWIERPDPDEGWMYRRGEIVRLIYTRWESPGYKTAREPLVPRLLYTERESPPHASLPNRPIDYLVVIPLTPRPEGEEATREPQSKAFRVEPAPVGLHLHCWGGSLNGGYGWWYNAHRGTVLIASNQIPYDWWTGYHEANAARMTYGDGHVQPFSMNRTFGFLDWAARQHREAPQAVREFWPPLDLTRVFTAGNSMGGSGAPMFAVRHGDRIAWAIGWVGIHVPELSPHFKGSYENSYGPRDPGITMPDGETSPWDYFSDVWWLRTYPTADTGMVIASNGKNDGGIGWEQAWQFARALQETRRPHIFNWGLAGHGTRTVVGSNFELDVRTDQTLPAFSNCSLDDDIGTAKRKADAQIEAERKRQEAEIKAGTRQHVHVDPYDGDSEGQYNAFLRWETDDLVDAPDRWEMTVYLTDAAPKDECTVDLTPRRCQRLKPKPGERFAWTAAVPEDGREEIASGEAAADEWGLVTVKRLPVRKGGVRVRLQRR